MSRTDSCTRILNGSLERVRRIIIAEVRFRQRQDLNVHRRCAATARYPRARNRPRGCRGLRGQELLPRRARPAGRGIDPGVMQDLPHRGRRDPVAELDELALHAPVPPRGIVCGDADHELADRGCRGWPSGTPLAGVVPFCVRRAAGTRRAASPRSRRTPLPSGAGGSAGTAPRATAGRPAGSGPGRLGGAAPRSHAAAPAARHLCTPHAGPAPSGSRAGNAQAGRRPRRSQR